MVHSLCRAGTASAALLNGNQQANPASGSADDKGMPKRLQQRQGSREICKNVQATNRQTTSVSAQKNVCPEIPRRKQDFKNRHYTFALRHKKSYVPAARLEETQGMSTPNGVRLA